MIGYPISVKQLETLIDVASPTWLTKARARTDGFRKKKAFTEKKSIWSDVKVVYMRHQGNSKCAFCERKLESEEYGKGEQAVEHFRPKGRVSAWELPDSLAKQGIVCTKIPKKKGGYYLLPYHLFNYSAACIPCNSALKRDCFPIAGAYDLDGDDPKSLLVEGPLLIYPIGDFDDAPEDLIGFHGCTPFAAKSRGLGRNRALVTIEFFKLGGLERTNLLRERAAIITALFPQLQVLDRATSGAAAKTTAKLLIDGFTSPRSAHTNCARSFCKLFENDQPEAQQVFDVAAKFVAEKS